MKFIKCGLKGVELISASITQNYAALCSSTSPANRITYEPHKSVVQTHNFNIKSNFYLFHNSKPCSCSKHFRFAHNWSVPNNESISVLFNSLLITALNDLTFVNFSPVYCDASWSNWKHQDHFFSSSKDSFSTSKQVFRPLKLAFARKPNKKTPQRTAALKWWNRTILSWTCCFMIVGAHSLFLAILPCYPAVESYIKPRC